MKKYIFSILLAIVAVSTALSQTVYKISYKGPTSTVALKTLLEANSTPLVKALDAATKASLIKFSNFNNGLPTGFSGRDSNIDNLYKTNFAALFSEIFQAKVVVNDNPTQHPEYSVVVNDPSGTALTGDPIIWSHCTACYPSGGCCHPGGKTGCWDALVGVSTK